MLVADAFSTVLAWTCFHVDRRLWLWYRMGVGRKCALRVRLHSFGASTSDKAEWHTRDPCKDHCANEPSLLVAGRNRGGTWLRLDRFHADVQTIGASDARDACLEAAQAHKSMRQLPRAGLRRQ